MITHSARSELGAPHSLMRRNASRILLLAALIVAPAWLLGAAPPVTTIEQEPPKIEYLTFDPAHPPPIRQSAPGIEAAFCGYAFEILSRFEPTQSRFTFGRGAITVQKVDLVLRLRITIWTPEGGPADYLAHEETHRAIAEHYYRDAGRVARELAAKIVGQKLDLPARKNQAMVDLQLRLLSERLGDDYLHATRERCALAEEEFDTITDHGREPIANAEAMKAALAAEEKHWETLQTARRDG